MQKRITISKFPTRTTLWVSLLQCRETAKIQTLHDFLARYIFSVEHFQFSTHTYDADRCFWAIWYMTCYMAKTLNSAIEPQAKCSTGIRDIKLSKAVWLWGQSSRLGLEHLALFYITDMHKTSIHKLVVDKLLIGTADTCFDRFRQLVKRLQVTFHLLQFFRQLLNQQTDKPLNNTVRRLHSIAVFNLNVSTYLGDSLAQLQCTGLGQQHYVGLP